MAETGRVITGGELLAPVKAFDAGKASRRLKGVTPTTRALNSQIRTYGKTVLARSRYLAANNPYAAQAKATYVSALVGLGIKPSSLVKDAGLKAQLQETWLDWTDETDADGLTDLYGQQGIVAAEMFEAGECFIRLRPRRESDGLTIPLQLQILPSEMLPFSDNQSLPGGRRIECGIEFNAIGKRVAYHFLRNHPGSELRTEPGANLTVRVPADEVLHLYKPFAAGQVRGIPHTLSAIVKLAILDQYDDAELERKRIAALFAAFIHRPNPEEPAAGGPLAGQKADAETAGVDKAIALEPGSISELAEGEEITFSNPADVGNSYEAFQMRTLLAVAAGFGVPYAAMTGDLRQTSYGSIRAGLVEFRRRIETDQHHVMVFQFCRPVWNRFIREGVLNGALEIGLSEFLTRERELRRVKWIAPHWEWIDPLKDLQAEELAVRNGFKSRGDVIEATGHDPEETDARITADRKREISIPPKSIFGTKPAPTSASTKEGAEDDREPAPPKPEEQEDAA